MSAPHAVSIVWFRRDLRLDDHVALDRAARESACVVCAFVLDPPLLRGDRVGAPIVAFFFDSLAELRARLRERASDLALLEGDFLTELRALAKRVRADAIYFNVDYDPAARARDEHVAAALRSDGLTVVATVDHVYRAAEDARKPDGSPYTVFSPYRRRWHARAAEDPHEPVPSLAAVARKLAPRALLEPTLPVPETERYGHERSVHFPAGGEQRGRELLDAFVAGAGAQYGEHRNFPALPGTSQLSPHLRAGTVGIRTCVRAANDALEGARGKRKTGFEKWHSELLWREFYQQILANFPHVAEHPFDERANALRYRESESDWQAWCAGRTGYPIVDAAMVQLNTTGWMHNRLRMIVASFLTKDLLLDYRLGERYFEQRLADADLASNNGGWQWSSSTGTDAAPYFRVFNPILQSRKFDASGSFIRAHLPALARLPDEALHAPWTLAPLAAEALGFRLGRDYPEPIVDHAAARERALEVYAPVLGRAVTRQEAGAGRTSEYDV